MAQRPLAKQNPIPDIFQKRNYAYSTRVFEGHCCQQCFLLFHKGGELKALEHKFEGLGTRIRLLGSRVTLLELHPDSEVVLQLLVVAIWLLAKFCPSAVYAAQKFRAVFELESTCGGTSNYACLPYGFRTPPRTRLTWTPASYLISN